ncbi:SAM-dependent methyltransferase [Spirillospora sp. NPDC048819]|uniref:SAM-dependent methyltransferase n=1 Tax=Spirillospora sp. NPDC048819 TaxID=3155268 RepID=UPI0033BFDAD2
MTTGTAFPDHHRPNPARLYDALLGGKDNYTADREAMECMMSVAPHVRSAALANRGFLEWTVRRLVTCGVTQFLDIGAGFPAGRNVHEIAQDVRPDSRVVYVDNDPVVVRHGQALLTTGGSTMIEADLRHPTSIVENEELRRLLDLERPVALLLFFVLDFVPHGDHPTAIVEQLLKAVAPGSYLAISHFVTDAGGHAAADAMTEAGIPVYPRTRAETHAMVGDLDVLLAGPLRPGSPHPGQTAGLRSAGSRWRYGVLARKPQDAGAAG